MREEPVLALADGNAKPIPLPDRGFDLEQQLTAYREQTSADAADAARPVLGNLVELERRIVDQGLNGGDDIVCGIAHSDTPSDRTHLGFGETGGELADRIGIEDAVGIDRDDDFRL